MAGCASQGTLGNVWKCHLVVTTPERTREFLEARDAANHPAMCRTARTRRTAPLLALEFSEEGLAPGVRRSEEDEQVPS